VARAAGQPVQRSHREGVGVSGAEVGPRGSEDGRPAKVLALAAASSRMVRSQPKTSAASRKRQACVSEDGACFWVELRTWPSTRSRSSEGIRPGQPAVQL